METLNLSQDMTEEILSRLSVKSLMRFKNVSKSWKSLISNVPFTRLHLQNIAAADRKSVFLTTYSYKRKVNEVKLFDHEAEVMTSLNFPPLTKGCDVNIKGICNGLVAISILKCNSSTGKWVSDLFLWNPSMGEYRLCISDLENKFVSTLRKLNPSMGEYRIFSHLSECFGYQFTGFGYDSSSDDYKLVFGFGPKINSVLIYSCKLKSWKSIETPPSNLDTIGDAVYLNGSLYWTSRFDIVAFDLKMEKFDTIANHRFLPELAVVDGSLYGIEYNTEVNPPSSTIWVLKKEQYYFWTKLLTLNTDGPAIHFLLSRSKGNEFLVAKFKQVLSYDIGSEKSKQILNCNRYKMRIYEAFVYEESLVSPNEILSGRFKICS